MSSSAAGVGTSVRVFPSATIVKSVGDLTVKPKGITMDHNTMLPLTMGSLWDLWNTLSDHSGKGRSGDWVTQTSQNELAGMSSTGEWADSDSSG